MLSVLLVLTPPVPPPPLKRQSETGSITRQEFVSMIPPLVLQVGPDHKVLDMCAAPGSKTSQLLEMLHADELTTGRAPTGMIVANDADLKRAFMLVHQCKRIGSPSLLVICHQAQLFPDMAKRPQRPEIAAAAAAAAAATAAANSGEIAGVGTYDRILCDVPCTGDGTMRKAPEIWRNWTPRSAQALHPLQLQILIRGAYLLREGGLMVYSTCR